MKVYKGFTLIEMLIVVAIIGILSAVVYPSYQESVRKSRRADAQAALMGLAQSLERYYTTETTYAGAAGTDLVHADTGAPRIFSIKSPIDGADTYYNLKIHSAAASTYVIAAEPTGAQTGDGILILKSTGARGWDVDNDANGVVGGLGASPNEVESSETCWKTSC